MTRTYSPITDKLILIACVFAVWQALYFVVGDLALTSPMATIVNVFSLVQQQSFWDELTETSRCFLLAYAVAAGAGVLVGVTLGSNRLAGDVATPVLTALYSIPKVTLYPCILILFGIGLSGKVAFAAFHGIIPMILFTASAVRQLSPLFRKSARVMNLSRWSAARSIYLPAALPEVLTGLRLAFALIMLGTLISEMFGARKGLGATLINAIGMHNVQLIMSLTFLLVAFAVTVNSILLGLTRRAEGAT